MTPAGHLNGQTVPTEPPPDPARDIAEQLYASGVQGGDIPWADLDEDQREDLTAYAEEHIAAHVSWLGQRGFRILPPNAQPLPQSEPEALAMLRAAKAFFDAKGRKGKLLGTAPKKLIVPGRAH